MGHEQNSAKTFDSYPFIQTQRMLNGRARSSTKALLDLSKTVLPNYDQKLCRVKTFFDAISALFA